MINNLQYLQHLQSIKCTTDRIVNQLTSQKHIQLSLLRLDEIHPVVSGNKWFKLKYYIRDAEKKGVRTLLTFGGAFSNHIAATAFAAIESGFNAIGIIRGEEPMLWSHTLQEALALGMQLKFLPRKEFALLKRTTSPEYFKKEFGIVYPISEGGYGRLGMQGAAEILTTTDSHNFTHIVSAIGTGATLAGIIQSANPDQQVIGISSMKNNYSLNSEIQSLLTTPLPDTLNIIHDYHFGGFAKHTPELFAFMNSFYHSHHIPLDFVYTAKMMYGIFDLIEKDFFPPQSRILAIHSGGLQGNLSLNPGILQF